MLSAVAGCSRFGGNMQFTITKGMCMFYGGIAGMILSAVLMIIFSIVFKYSRKKIMEQIEKDCD
jgi:hypothetical protein